MRPPTVLIVRTLIGALLAASLLGSSLGIATQADAELPDDRADWSIQIQQRRGQPCSEVGVTLEYSRPIWAWASFPPPLGPAYADIQIRLSYKGRQGRVRDRLMWEEPFSSSDAGDPIRFWWHIPANAVFDPDLECRITAEIVPRRGSDRDRSNNVDAVRGVTRG